MPRALFYLSLVLLAACAPEGPPEPLSTFEIRDRFFGHMMEAQAPDGTRTIYRFWRANQAQRIGDASEFIRWYADGTNLCLQEHDAAAVCAPVWQLNPAHYRWRDLTFSDLTVRQPDIGFDRDRDHNPGFMLH